MCTLTGVIMPICIGIIVFIEFMPGMAAEDEIKIQKKIMEIKKKNKTGKFVNKPLNKKGHIF